MRKRPAARCLLHKHNLQQFNYQRETWTNTACEKVKDKKNFSWLKFGFNRLNKIKEVLILTHPSSVFFLQRSISTCVRQYLFNKSRTVNQLTISRRRRHIFKVPQFFDQRQRIDLFFHFQLSMNTDLNKSFKLQQLFFLISSHIQTTIKSLQWKKSWKSNYYFKKLKWTCFGKLFAFVLVEKRQLH